MERENIYENYSLRPLSPFTVTVSHWSLVNGHWGILSRKSQVTGDSFSVIGVLVYWLLEKGVTSNDDFNNSVATQRLPQFLFSNLYFLIKLFFHREASR